MTRSRVGRVTLPPRVGSESDHAGLAGSSDARTVDSEVETPKEKTDRQLVELLNELRVALPGAQFLFAFLLAVPFAARFTTVQRDQRVVFFACLVCTILATILLMAPAVYHRVRWQHGNKAEVIRIAHRMFLAGMSCLGLAMIAAVWFLSDFLLGAAAAVAATTLSLGALVITWGLLPVLSRSDPEGKE